MPHEQFKEFASPVAFTTEFRPAPVDEGDEMPNYKRLTSVEAAKVDVRPIADFNLSIGRTSDARVVRLNEGIVDKTGTAQAFDLVPVAEHRVMVHGGAPWLIPGQRVVREAFDRLSRQQRARRDTDLLDEQVGLIARKRTDAVFLTPNVVQNGLDVARVGRSVRDTGVRAALVSATHLLMQRAALEFDIAPEEFEALEPRLRDGRPLIQMADFLINGAGFSNRLAEGSVPLAAKLAREMVVNWENDPLVAGFFTASHRDVCSQACYECVQRYGNRAYHGLLDWRLGIAMLRVFVDGSWRAGLDGLWSETPEISDWPALAARLAGDMAALSPDKYEISTTGTLKLPTVHTRRAPSWRVVLVHPFWSDEASKALCADGFGGSTYFVDTFHAARRPQRALQAARQADLARSQ